MFSSFDCMRCLKLQRFSVYHMEFTSEGVSSASLSWSLLLKQLFCWKSRLGPVSFPLQVWSLTQPDWHCKIDEGSIGLLSSRWSPDGRHILNTTEFHVSVKAVCAWSLAFMRSGVCLWTSLSGFNCCWPVKKGNLKIARHQSLPWPPPHPPPPTRYMYSAWFHCRLPVSILPHQMLENLSNTGGTSSHFRSLASFGGKCY